MSTIALCEEPAPCYAKRGFHPDGARALDPGTGTWQVRLVRRT